MQFAPAVHSIWMVFLPTIGTLHHWLRVLAAFRARLVFVLAFEATIRALVFFRFMIHALAVRTLERMSPSLEARQVLRPLARS